MRTGATPAPVRRPSREDTVRTYLHRWAETAGAQLLVVDAHAEREPLTAAMAGRGVHLVWAESTVDGLVEFGRIHPTAVVIDPRVPGIPAAEFVTVIRRHGAAYVIAVLERTAPEGASALLVAGASAVVPAPYTANHLWEALSASPEPIAERAHLAVGPIELDAGAYRVTIAGTRIPDLPLKEFELLRELMLHAPGVVTDDQLRTALWGTGRASGNTIAMHVTRLRARLGNAAEVRRIRGRGYSLTV